MGGEGLTSVLISSRTLVAPSMVNHLLLVERPFRLFATWNNAQKLNTMASSASVGVNNILHDASERDGGGGRER